MHKYVNTVWNVYKIMTMYLNIDGYAIIDQRQTSSASQIE